MLLKTGMRNCPGICVSIQKGAAKLPTAAAPRYPPIVATRKPVLPCALAVFAVAVLPRLASAEPSSVSPEQGWDLGDVQTPRAVAMGGAQAAFGTSTNGIYYNPANLPFSRVYHFEGMGSFSPEARRLSGGGAIVDSSTSRLAGGLGGQYITSDPDGLKRQAIDLRLALAFPFSDKVAIGAVGKYLRTEQSVAKGPFGRSLVSDGTPDGAIGNGFSFDAGLTVAPIQELRLAVVGRNLSNPGTGLQPTNLLFGAGYGTQSFTLEANGLVDFTTYQNPRLRAMAGAEYFLFDRVPLRLGYRYDDGLRTHSISGGIGYVDTRFSIEFGLRREVIADNPATMMGVAARFFFDGGNSGAPGGGGADGSAF